MLYDSSWQSITDEIRVNKIKSYSVRWWNQGCSKSRTYPRIIAIVLEPHDDDSLNVGVRSCSPNFQTNPNSSWNRSPIIWEGFKIFPRGIWPLSGSISIIYNNYTIFFMFHNNYNNSFPMVPGTNLGTNLGSCHHLATLCREPGHS